MEELTDVLDMDFFNDAEDAEILKQLSAFYAFTRKGMEVVEKVYPDMVPFVQHHRMRSYDDVKAALLLKLQ